MSLDALSMPYTDDGYGTPIKNSPDGYDQAPPFDGEEERGSALRNPSDNRELARVAIHLARPIAAKPGGSFMLDVPAQPPVVWGSNDHVAWTQGEYVLFIGPGGVGKSTIAQQVVLPRAGIRTPAFLGMDVTPDDRKVLYLALDRPAQIRRSFHRMVTEADRHLLDDRVVVWDRPLPLSVLKNTEIIAALAVDLGAGMVIVDSLKDIHGKLSDEEVGQAIKEAFQVACIEGIEVAAVHHLRKRAQGSSGARSADDTYGSAHIFNGAGSAFIVDGASGDAVVNLTHVKQPTADSCGPWQLVHDHQAGATRIEGVVDLANIVATSNGLTPEGAARAMYKKETPTPSEIEKARYRLEKLVASGHAVKQGGGKNAGGKQEAARYWHPEKAP